MQDVETYLRSKRIKVVMKLFKQRLLLCCGIFIIGTVCQVKAENYIPWDELAADWWIDFGGEVFDGPRMYPVNAATDPDLQQSYEIWFAQAKTDNKASGMNALKFIHGGLMEGHLVSRDKAGSFQIFNSGDSNIFTDVLILVAIGADYLDADFSITLNLAGQTPYVLDVNDFIYYDNQYGRPSGFYSITDPNVEPISYAFNTAMVSVYGVSGLTALEPTDPAHPEYENKITIEYSFNYVPAPVIFSVYGYAGGDTMPTIYHTNRAFIDQNNKSKPISTFAVTVDGDINGDLKVDLADFALLSGNWLVGAD